MFLVSLVVVTFMGLMVLFSAAVSFVIFSLFTFFAEYLFLNLFLGSCFYFFGLRHWTLACRCLELNHISLWQFVVLVPNAYTTSRLPSIRIQIDQTIFKRECELNALELEQCWNFGNYNFYKFCKLIKFLSNYYLQFVGLRLL